MWQRAQIINTDTEYKVCRDMALWIKVSKPVISGPSLGKLGNQYCEGICVYITNIYDTFDNINLQVDAKCVELLPEFADDVELIKWSDFWEACVDHYEKNGKSNRNTETA